MNKPFIFKGRPIIQPGETYEIDGTLHKVITATSNIIGENGSSISMSTPMYWLVNLETTELVYMALKELESKLHHHSTI